MPVDVAPAIARNVTDWDEFSGRLEAVERVEVRPLVGGTITAVHFATAASSGRATRCSPSIRAPTPPKWPARKPR